jgi:hypothetical protein
MRLDLVGPKGYEHGWKFVGVPGVTPHSELLKQRSQARAIHPAGHPERLKAEQAVRRSRKMGMHTSGTSPASRAATGDSSADKLRQQHEAMARKYPGLSWDSYEQNAVDQGHPEGSAAYHRSVLGQAQADKPLSPARAAKAQRLLNAEFTPTEKAVYAPVTPGESGTGRLGSPPDVGIQKAYRAAALQSAEARQKLGTPRKPGGIHPDEITVQHHGMQKAYHYPTSRERRRGTPVTSYDVQRSSLSVGSKHIGTVESRLGGGSGSFTSPGGSEKFPPVLSGKTHAEHIEKAKGLAAATTNARRIRSALSSSGHSAVKSHGTSVRGWRNYDPGHEVSAGDTGVRIEHYTGSSLMQGNREAAIERNLKAYAEKLRKKGFALEWHYDQNGNLTHLFVPNANQGIHYTGGSQATGTTTKLSNVDLSAETPMLAATPAPLGKPGGPGLYRLKGAKLPNYIENMRNALMRGGMSEGRATATAISRCKVLAATSKHPEVKAAAAAAIAELKATAARAKAAHGHANEPARVVELFNPYHAPAGSPAGGQFSAKSGGSSSSQPKQKAKPQRFLPSGKNANAGASQKKQLLSRAKAYRARANALETQLHGLVGQLHSLNSGKSTTHGGSKATGTTTKGKTAKVKKAKKTTTTAKKTTTAAKKTTAASAQALQRATLVTKIGKLRGQIKTLRSKAAQLVKRANAL